MDGALFFNSKSKVMSTKGTVRTAIENLAFIVIALILLIASVNGFDDLVKVQGVKLTLSGDYQTGAAVLGLGLLFRALIVGSVR